MNFNLGKLVGLVDIIGGSVPVYRTNKRRAAVVAHHGYAGIDWFERNRPLIFGVAVAASVASTIVGIVRRKHGAESWALWFGLAAGFAGLAYLSTPTDAAGKAVGGTDGQPATASKVPTGVKKAEKWLDAQAALLDIAEPGWEDATTKRITG